MPLFLQLYDTSCRMSNAVRSMKRTILKLMMIANGCADDDIGSESDGDDGNSTDIDDDGRLCSSKLSR